MQVTTAHPHPHPEAAGSRPVSFSGVQPTGRLHLGNYLGAVRRWVARQDEVDGVYCVVNLHAFTVDADPAEVAARTDEAFALLLACGLDPGRSLVFVQGDVPAHTELTYLLQCTATYGEMRRMIQFREKSQTTSQDSVRFSLLSYPTLMAADILLYDTDVVPVGADQAQHVELTRRLAVRFNQRYGRTFTVPALSLPSAGARVMDLQDPTRKMSKSYAAHGGTIGLLDPPDVVRRTVRRAVTDSGSQVRYDPAGSPGVSNLLDVLAAVTGTTPDRAAEGIAGYAALKEAVAEAVVEELRPVRERYRELRADPAGLARLRAGGARRAGQRAAAVLDRVRGAVHLLPAAGGGAV